MTPQPIIDHVQAFVLKSPAIFGLLLFGFTTLIRYAILFRSRRMNYPIVGKGISSELKADLIEGAAKVF
jgi:hypothetical protein